MSFVVPNQRIVHEKEDVAYTIKMDRLGGVDLEIKLSVGEHVPEEKYTDVFREVFINIGLPEEDVDKFRFRYSPSVIRKRLYSLLRVTTYLFSLTEFVRLRISTEQFFG